MFGHDKDENKNDPDLAQPMSTQPVNQGLLGIDDDDSSKPPSTSSNEPTGAPTPAGVDDFSSASSDDTSVPSPTPTPTVNPITTPSTPALNSNDDDLLNIKREALQELSPLIDHLEQDSEEKFKTTMMMIQASDNKALLPQAFQAAKEIKDEKKRAQALLDIVNEINYFTHKSED